MSNIRDVYHYSRSTFFAFCKRPYIKTLWYTLRYAYPCLKYYNNPKHNSIIDAQPWMAFPAIGALEELLNKNCKVFEYGSGGSTLFFANRVKKVVSIEHHPEWYVKVKEEIAKRKFENVEYKLIEPVLSQLYDRKLIADPNAYVSDDENSVGMIYESYAKAIMQYPDNYFDLVVIDGRVRPSCILHSLSKVKKGGILLLDQSEREYYLIRMKEFLNSNEWSKISYMAPQPYNLHFTETTFFIKRKLIF